MRTLAGEAWETELRAALLELYEDFGKWADDGLSSFELSDRIHAYHDGVARELYKLYTGADTSTLVSRGVAFGLISEGALTTALASKLSEEIQYIRERNAR